MRRVLAGLLLLLACAVVGAWLAWPVLTTALRHRLEAVLAAALGQPVHVEKLSLFVVPLEVRLDGMRVGSETAPSGQLAAAEVQLWVVASLLQRRPVLSVRIQSLALDLTRLAPAPTPPEPNGSRTELPSLQLRSVELEDAVFSFGAGGTETVLSLARLSGAFDSARGDHTWNVTVDANGVQVDRGKGQLNIEKIQVAGGADRQGLVVQTAVVEGDGLRLALRPTLMPREYALSAFADFSKVAPLAGQPLLGEAKIEGKLSGDLANPAVDVQLAISHLAWAGDSFGDLNSQLVRRGESVRLAAEVNGPVGHAIGNATLATAGALPLEASFDLEGVDLNTALRVAGVELEIGNAVTGAVGVSGTFQPLALEVRADASVAAARLPEHAGSEIGRKLATVQARLRTEAGQGMVRWDVQQPEQNRVTGEISWQEAQLRGAMQAQVPDLAALSRVLPKQVRDLGLTGQLDGTAALSGPTSAPSLEASIAGRDLSVMGAAVPRLSGGFSIINSTLRTSGLKLDTTGGGAELTGSIALRSAPANDWQLTLRGVDTDIVAGLVHAFTAATVPVSRGGIDGSVRVSGRWGQAAIEGRMALRSVYLDQEPFELIDVKVATDLPRWTAYLNAVHLPGETITIDGSGDAAGAQVSLASTPFRLGNLRGASRRKLAGNATVQGTISGRLSQPNGSLTASVSDLVIGGSALGDLTIEAGGLQGEWKINASAFKQALEADATVRLTRGYPYSLVVQTRGLDFGRLLTANESLHTALTARVDLTGSAAAWSAANGSVRIAQLQIRRDQYEVKAQDPIRIDVSAGRFVIHPAVLAAPSSQLKVAGELTLSGQVDLQARGEGDLVLLELIGKPFHSAQGHFNVSAHVRRDVAGSWNLSGQGQVREAVFDVGLPVAFADVNGEVLLSGTRVHIAKLDGKVGGGRFQVDGSVGLEDGPELSWQLQDVALTTDQGLEAQLAGKGQMQGPWQAMTVSGDIEIQNALYDRNIELKDFLPSLREQITPPPRTTPPTVRVRLNLRIRAPGGLHIDNNVAEVELGADLRLVGTADKPELTGTIEFLNGEVKFKQRTFTITAGSIDFRDRSTINPVLNISAESQISTAESDYVITVTVTGTAENPRIQPSADDPSLSETDILSLITFGQTTAQLQRQGGGVSAYDAVALLPTGTVTGPLAKLIGVNRLEIETVQSQTMGAAGSTEPRVTIGKDITDRLRATASTAFGAATERNVQLDYRLTRQLSVFGTWEGQTSEQSGAFGGGVRLRYEFRHMPFSLFPGDLEPETRSDAP